MYSARNQRTLAATASVQGVGYWSGREVRVEFRAVRPDTGVVFVRDDLPGFPRVAAVVENRTDTPLRTTLNCDGIGVDMVEHVMAALSGLQIDNCEVHVDQQELPGLDGSSLPLVEALNAAGVVRQDAVRRRRVIREVLRLGDAKSWIEARPCCGGETILQYDLDYGAGNSIGRQSLEVKLSAERFTRDVAPSRTFMLDSEAAALQAQGLGCHVNCADLLVFGPDGPIDNQLRFPDECVRHKLLDMVGDLALAGCDLIGRFVAHRSGHRLNAELVRAILAETGNQQPLQRCA